MFDLLKRDDVPNAEAKELPEGIRGVAWQQEAGEEQQHPHLQMYMQTYRKTTPLRAAALLKLQPGEYHIEIARGTTKQNLDYVSKDSTRMEGFIPRKMGEFTNQGQRCDLDALYEASKSKSMVQMWEEHGADMMRYHKSVAACQAALAKPRGISKVNGKWVVSRENAEVILYLGRTGTGKSTAAMEYALRRFDGNVYFKPSVKTWWDGYHGQPCVLIDDYAGTRVNGAPCGRPFNRVAIAGDWPIEYLLGVLQNKPFTSEVKGSTVELQATCFIITTNMDIDEMYPSANESHKAALRRRITHRRILDVKHEPGTEEVVDLTQEEAPATLFSDGW